MSTDFAYLATFGNKPICLSGGGPRLPNGQNGWMSSNRIKELRKSKGMTLEELAGETSLSTSYLQRLENGERNLAVKHLNVIARALQVGQRELISADESNPVVSVVGRIGAGQEILPEFEQLPPEGLFQIEVPFPVPPNTLAFEVDGDSMWPRYDPGDVVLCWKEGVNAAEVIGWEAAVMTDKGQRYLKRIMQGSKTKLFNLESFNAPVIRDVRLKWISKVQAVVRAGEWRQIGRTAQKKIAKKLGKTKS
jgi:transcriptional regulator with XRE-family HTH domain